MDTSKLKYLKEIAQGLSILYVEDSTTLQKQVGRFLGKMFDTFFQAYNGHEGFNYYKKYKPDIVITDLTMPRKNGIDMIVDIKSVNPEAKIIVLSAHNDDLTLLKTIDLGIKEFMLKPLDLDKLTLTLIDIIEAKQQTSQCLKDLNIIKEQNTHLNFISSYKGVPIQNDGVIVSIENEVITAKVSPMQIVAVKFDKHILLELREIDKFIKVDLISIDEENNTITFENPEYTSFTIKEFQYKRIKVDSEFKLGIHYKNHNLEVTPIGLSFISIAMHTSGTNLPIKLNDEIDITLGFFTKSANNIIKQKNFSKVFAKGKIIKIEETKSSTILVSLIKLKKADDRVFLDYIKERKVEILKEFNGLVQSD